MKHELFYMKHETLSSMKHELFFFFKFSRQTNIYFKLFASWLILEAELGAR